MTSYPLKYKLLSARYYKYLRYYLRLRKAEKREEAELKLLRFLVPRDKIAVDVGANKGTYTLPLSWYAASVHAFEPHPLLHRYLTEAFPCGNVTVHPVALGNADDQGELTVPLTSGSERRNVGSLLKAGSSGEVQIYAVRLARLDRFALAPVGFLKIDVEGFEMEVIRGAEATIERNRPNILCEILDFKRNQIEEGIEKIEYVERLGYVTLVYGGSALALFSKRRVPQEGPLKNFIFLPRS